MPGLGPTLNGEEIILLGVKGAATSDLRNVGVQTSEFLCSQQPLDAAVAVVTVVVNMAAVTLVLL